MGLVPVHFFNLATWRVAPGWLNPSAVAIARSVRVDVVGLLCPECASKIELPSALGLALLDGSKHVILGDGRSSDSHHVKRARRLERLRARCEREQHPGGPGSF